MAIFISRWYCLGLLGRSYGSCATFAKLLPFYVHFSGWILTSPTLKNAYVRWGPLSRSFSYLKASSIYSLIVYLTFFLSSSICPVYFISWYLLILFFLRQLGWYSYMDSNMLKPVHQHEPVMYRWNTYPSKFLRLFSSVKSLVWSSFQLLSNMYLLYYLTWNIPSRWSCRSFNCFFSTRMEQESRASSVLLRINEYLTVTCINNFNWF